MLDASQGAPNYPPPISMAKSIIASIHEEHGYSYTYRQGLPELREEVAQELNQEHNFLTDAENILITSGCNAAFCSTMSALLNPDDEVILPVPYYFNHKMWIEQTGAKPILTPHLESGIPDVKSIQEKINSRTRAIVIVSPGNPTGATIPVFEQEKLVHLAKSFNIALILDETYRDFAKNGTGSPFSGQGFELFPELIRLLSFSKELAIPGFRVGAVCAHSSLIVEILKIHDCFSICTPHLSQIATITGLRSAKEWRKTKSIEIASKRQLFTNLIADQPGGFNEASAGGFFSWIKHPFPNLNSWEVVERLLEKEGILTLPGSIFGPGQDEMIRVSVANLTELEINTLSQKFSLVCAAT